METETPNGVDPAKQALETPLAPLSKSPTLDWGVRSPPIHQDNTGGDKFAVPDYCGRLQPPHNLSPRYRGAIKSPPGEA